MVADADCIFCAIVRGEAPASIVHDDADTLAFMDINPVTPGHLLVIPKHHATFLADLPAGAGGQLMEIGVALAAALRQSGLRGDGVNFFLADGAAAGQEVFHVHLHVFPRYPGDQFAISADWSRPPARAALDAIAAAIRAVGAAATVDTREQ